MNPISIGTAVFSFGLGIYFSNEKEFGMAVVGFFLAGFNLAMGLM